MKKILRQFCQLMKPADYLVVLLACALVTGGILLTRDRSAAALVRIEWEGKTLVYPLDAEKIIPLEGKLGFNTLVITGQGQVYISESDCHDKTCISMGTISRNGEFVACLPHRLFVTITGKEEKEDALDSALW